VQAKWHRVCADMAFVEALPASACLLLLLLWLKLSL
jgi:hypothetical protein